ncbi:TetR/AcrR family transcriptional regulator [Roseobacter sp. SK209-2-6]|uniref:TetR/AcrR family transcriptional regulator n=1 Tax=Roseobacter sp. SK209-2-6 TaxID=388739 RepID=UPI00055D69C2|nr:TetR/AcrR family transcriptional regulator [Roseobacter sp. SK209-2-6]
MPRPTSFTSDQLADRALQHFWVNGFHASSMDDLVRATEVSRHGIYATFGGKGALFLACFDKYQETVVTPAFGIVESTDANLQSVSEYFERQISLGETAGLPGPGCFVVNSATEVAPNDPAVAEKVAIHNDRLRLGFAHALRGSAFDLDQDKALELADVMVIFTNGLWTSSRNVTEGNVLRQAVARFLNLLTEAMQ